MNIEPARPSMKNPPEQFAGDAWVDLIAAPHDGEQRAMVVQVRFAPGTRTAWHSHARGQYCHVTDGVALFGDRAGNVIEVYPGQTIYTPPGQEHWHAAPPDTFMSHIALLEAGEDPATTTVWGEHITDDQYGRH